MSIQDFDWVPFFEQMALKLLAFENKQMALIQFLKDANVNGLDDKEKNGRKTPLKEIDPFTFVGLICKHSSEDSLKRILKVLKEKLNIRAKVQASFHGIPIANGQQTWLFSYKAERKNDDVKKLWTLFKQSMKGLDSIEPETFLDAIDVKCSGTAKLTQALFRARPSIFLPVDSQTSRYLARRGLRYKFYNLKEYLEVIESLSSITTKDFFRVSYEAYLENKEITDIESFNISNIKQASKSSNTFNDKPGPEKKPILKARTTIYKYARNSGKSAHAIRKADFKCELDPHHKTFNSKAANKPYVEAHHLIPLGAHYEFENNLDVVDNIVSLCPNCHRLLHHSIKEEKQEKIRILFEKRRVALESKGLAITFRSLFKYYGDDLFDDL
ncbi:HNH endonuclease [Methylophilus sp. Leaf414]|uniref:HNH endonuclease n=1 Tax=Methylophilus sp. Leaf414 TaxID=1736371 RepID=UPI0006FFBB32|nr:HNH endonuclease [Methylophilus sp. Leaf414]KQT34066.1 hypothetical protein ASG24_09930 [Methylophilus sp. Leaf414]